MVSSLLDITPLLPAIEGGEPIITANNRLRNHLLRAWGQHQRRQGRQVWLTPVIVTLSQWLQEAWQELQNRRVADTAFVVANSDQRLWLWEQIIANAPDNELLLAEPLAQAADTALTQLERWRLEDAILDPASADAFSLNSNSQSFYGWLNTFRATMAERGWITREQAWERIARHWPGSLPVHPVVHLLGFDELLPLESHVLESAAGRCETVQLPLPAGRCERTSAADEEAELLAAALWSKAHLEANPEASIGIILPNLGQIRDKAERLFSEIFEPLAGMPEQPRYTPPFNFSAGTPLGSTPLIHAALSLLGLYRSELDLESLCDLLLSPFFGNSEAEVLFRSALVQELRDTGRFVISNSDLRYHARRVHERWLARDLTDEHNGLVLLNALNRFYEDRRHKPSRGNALQWSQWFSEQLAQLGWPGERRPDSQEYQQLLHWHRLLEQFATLDSHGQGHNELLSVHQALTRLSRMAAKTPFQAKTPDSPIQILGALEGDGLQFSACWVTGLHHRQWPPAPAPNPFLPIQLQRDLAMPHASAEREFHYASRLTNHYRQCAPEVVFSYPEHDEIGELRPSALIETLPVTPLAQLTGPHPGAATVNRERLQQSARLELVETARGPALGANETVRGGSSLLKNQAACPFNAFAQARLGASWPDPPCSGFSASDRGNILHAALAMLWQDLGNARTLRQLNEQQLQERIAAAVAEAIRPIKKHRRLGDRYAELEQERQSRLIFLWLEKEKERPDFEVVAFEESRKIEFAGLSLRLQLDRIDRLANGQLLVIDYKTGSSHINSWLGERPGEPQLPLYAITSEQPVDGIAFAQLNASKQSWAGLGADNLQHPGIKPPGDGWAQMLADWQRILTRLAEDFTQGVATVDFRDSLAERYSEPLRPLNRCLEKDIIHQRLQQGDRASDEKARSAINPQASINP